VLAYIFEKFPSFTQTFCAREVSAINATGIHFPVYSIRRPGNEPASAQMLYTGAVETMPEKYDTLLAENSDFRRRARKAIDDMKRLWGDESEKRRIYEALWLAPRLKEQGVKHVHTHFAGIGARTAFWLNRLAGINYSLTAHANDIFRDETRERLEQIFGAAAFVVTVSDFSCRYLKQNYPKLSEKFHRVYNGIEMDKFRSTSFPQEKPLIVSVGRYIEKKGFQDLISACAALGDRSYECLIIGHGPLEDELRQQVASLGLVGRVIIAGPKSEAEIAELLSRAYLFVLPCVTSADGAMDNLPTVIMEAMAAGLPVVSTRLAGVPEMVLDGKTGAIVEEHDVPAVAEKMAELLDNPELAKAQGAAGYALCKEIFDCQVTSISLIDLFRKYRALPSK